MLLNFVCGLIGSVLAFVIGSSIKVALPGIPAEYAGALVYLVLFFVLPLVVRGAIKVVFKL